MAAIPVTVQRVDPAMDLEADLRRARWLATLLDAQFDVGGFKFGLDPIVDLIPVAGDVVMTVVGLYPIYLARKHKLGKTIELRMALNLGLDFLIGALPIVGSVFDAAYRANLKNVDLLEKAAAKR